MKLLIHDLNEAEWNKISADYEGWEVVAGNEGVAPCAGCFGCWFSTPGECVIKDGYNHMGELIHKADEVVFMSRYTYGGFSSSVKSVVDRSIGYILPFFSFRKGEMHHKPRYRDIKPLRFIFRGEGLTEEDKEKARKYAEAVRTNLNGKTLEIRFEECEADNSLESKKADSVLSNQEKKTLFINCSMHGEDAKSKRFLDVLAEKVDDHEHINIASYVKNMDQLRDMVLAADKIVLGMPLYVDGIPSLPLRLMEMLEKAHAECDKKIYVVANMGFFESKQIVNLLSMVKMWCKKSGFNYCGGMAIGAGQMMGSVIRYKSNGPGKFVYDDLLRFGDAINAGEAVEDIYTKSNKFPLIAYYIYGNRGMLQAGKSNGLSKRDLMKRID